MNEIQRASLDAMILRLGCEDDAVVIADDADGVECVLGIEKGRARRVLVGPGGEVVAYEPI